jgi:Na+-translocating ferredoxin:NAD+ oxidoreductase subunit A
MSAAGVRPFGAACVLMAFVLMGLQLALPAACSAGASYARGGSFKGTDAISVSFRGPVDEGWAKDPASVAACAEADPDIALKVASVELAPNRRSALIRFAEPLNQSAPHLVTLREIRADGASKGSATVTVRKGYLGALLTILLSAMLIKNFIFTKYLGLCVFFGTSQKKSTAIGMGITFTLVMVASAMLSWFLYQFVLKPLRLDFLQIIVFIGMVSLSVQAVDTILRKVNPALFKAFGVYLVLVIANCIILAVPLTIAVSEYNAIESFMLALGAGAGFLVALFLMSSVRERLDLANVPPCYRGLPIAFITAGLFALAFMGFSGMTLF